jgi:histidine triad (HIT) family protein
MAKDCVFCKIAAGELPADFIKVTDRFMVFSDLHPSAPVHILIIPKEHYPTIAQMPDELWLEARDIALQIGMERRMKGFRFVNNYGSSALINHVHMHMLGGITKRRKV